MSEKPWAKMDKWAEPRGKYSHTFDEGGLLVIQDGVIRSTKGDVPQLPPLPMQGARVQDILSEPAGTPLRSMYENAVEAVKRYLAGDLAGMVELFIRRSAIPYVCLKMTSDDSADPGRFARIIDLCTEFANAVKEAATRANVPRTSSEALEDAITQAWKRASRSFPAQLLQEALAEHFGHKASIWYNGDLAYGSDAHELHNFIVAHLKGTKIWNRIKEVAVRRYNRTQKDLNKMFPDRDTIRLYRGVKQFYTVHSTLESWTMDPKVAHQNFDGAGVLVADIPKCAIYSFYTSSRWKQKEVGSLYRTETEFIIIGDLIPRKNVKAVANQLPPSILRRDEDLIQVLEEGLHPRQALKRRRGRRRNRRDDDSADIQD